MERVLCGIDQLGKHHPGEHNLAKDLQGLAEGISIVLPDDERGGEKTYTLKFWLLAGSADMLAANSLGPYAESTRPISTAGSASRTRRCHLPVCPSHICIRHLMRRPSRWSGQA